MNAKSGILYVKVCRYFGGRELCITEIQATESNVEEVPNNAVDCTNLAVNVRRVSKNAEY
jgi:hypothetical protein